MNLPTYISLFSSAGIGCYGLQQAGFACVATNELIEKRLEIQKINLKCKYDSGYICGDITDPTIKHQIQKELLLWQTKEHMQQLDVLVATPPCQGMSTANYKKNNEIHRNSLVVEAIHLVQEIQPRIFIFENVKAFLKTSCVDKDEKILTIQECIFKHLAQTYNIFAKVVNFMDYGVPSSRPRTLVIGVLKSEKNFSPLNLFPLKRKHIPLYQAIGDLPALDYGETATTDILHSFRTYPLYMREWIHSLKEGETAFNNPPDKIPYKFANGKKQILKSGHMGNKFRRMFWNLPAPCITTRNDQLASQSTIHPADDRVLSIRELMRVMTIPSSFKWVPDTAFSAEEIHKKETLIRQVIGEAVPTFIIYQIAKNIREMLEFDDFVKQFKKHSKQLGYTNNFYIQSFLFEQTLTDAKETGSFYTPQSVVYHTIKNFHPKQKKLSLLDPAVGAGAFIPQLLRLVDDCEDISITCVDISKDCIKILKNLLKMLDVSSRITFHFLVGNTLLMPLNSHYDAVVCNPPYFKLTASEKAQYRPIFPTTNDNIFCLFLKRLLTLSNEIMVVIPKIFLMVPDCNDIRKQFEDLFSIVSIEDYGISFFNHVFIEIISIHFKKDYTDLIYITNHAENKVFTAPQKYIYHDRIWLLYRDSWFDDYISSLKLNVFDFYKDRQLTNKYLTTQKKRIWVLRSKNLQDDGKIIHIKNYDKYIDSLEGFTLNKYLNKSPIIFVNFTYNTRAAYLPDNCIVNGSFCLLFPKIEGISVPLSFFSSLDFRHYYAIVKNYSKFTINVDRNTIYYIGVPKK